MTPQSSGARSARGLVIIVSVVVAGLLGGSSLAVGADNTNLASPEQTTCSPVHLEVSNPQPGDLLTPGSYVVQGLAVDISSAQSPGIDRVQVFFDQSRDSGGRLLGQVLAGDQGPVQRLTSSGFAVVADIPETPAENDTHMVYVYARSAQTGAEQVLTFSVQVDKPLSVGFLTPTPTPPPATLAQVPCGSPTPTPTFPPFPIGLAAATPGAAATLTLQVANPASGDTLAHGLYVIQGVAFDTSAQSGTGVDHVTVFLDPRDQGGQLLGEAALGIVGPGGPYGFQLAATLPDRRGGHQLTVYAHSAVSGHETSVTIPISIT